MTVELISVTQLSKEALGVGEGIVNWTAEGVAEAAVDRFPILRQFVEDGDRDGAMDWLMQERFKKSNIAKDRGSEIHKVAEQLHLGNTIEYDEKLEPWIVQYRRFLEDFQPAFEMAEAPVYNFTYRYAGTTDGIAKIQGQRVIFDIKTTEHGPNAKTRKGRPKSRPPFSEVALQLTMYRRAERVGLVAERKEIQWKRYYVIDETAHLEPMPEVEGGVCIVVSPEDYLVVPVDTSERIWKACRHVIQVAKFQTETAKAVFGPAISPKLEEVLS